MVCVCLCLFLIDALTAEVLFFLCFDVSFNFSCWEDFFVLILGCRYY